MCFGQIPWVASAHCPWSCPLPGRPLPACSRLTESWGATRRRVAPSASIRRSCCRPKCRPIRCGRSRAWTGAWRATAAGVPERGALRHPVWGGTPRRQLQRFGGLRDALRAPLFLKIQPHKDWLQPPKPESRGPRTHVEPSVWPRAGWTDRNVAPILPFPGNGVPVPAGAGAGLRVGKNKRQKHSPKRRCLCHHCRETVPGEGSSCDAQNDFPGAAA